MKLTALFLITCLFGLHANDSYAQRTKLTLDIENASIREVIDNIETTSKFKFIYKIKHVDLDRKISIKAYQDRIDHILDRMFFQTDTEYVVRGLHIILREKEKAKVPDPVIVEEDEEVQDPIKLTGTISDEDGRPLPGANIIEKGTANGIVSDFDGKFDITVADRNAILVISYIGYVTKEVAVANQDQINVQLDPDTGRLDEVVVVGYGTQVKSKVTAAVTQLDSEIFVDRPVTSISQALSGIDPGINVQPSSSGGGRPGATPEISIRGEYSVDNRAETRTPLVLVDGFEASIRDVDPNQIKSVTILKDAASTAIYGVRAGSGVILITTKEGGRNRPTTFNYRFAGSVSKPVSLPDVLSTPEYMEFYNYAAVNEEKYVVNVNNPDFETTDFFPVFSEDVINRARNGEFPDTDWQDVLFNNTATLFQHSLDASGGTDKSSYLLSLGVLDQEGVNVGKDEFKRYNFRVKLDTDITDWMTVGVNMAYTRSEEVRVAGPGGEQDRRPEPHYPITDEYFGGTGVFVQPANGFTDNAVWNAAQDLDTRTRDVIEMAVSGQFKIAKGLTFDQKVNLRIVNFLGEFWDGSIPYLTYNFDGQTGEYTNESPGEIPEGPFAATRSLTVADQRTAQLTTQSLLNYNLNVNDVHSIGVLAGWQTESNRSDYFDAFRSGFPSDALQRLDVGDLTNWQNSSGGSLSGQSRYLSAFARLTYDYKEKYLIQGTIRRDGSSDFGPGNRWGTFPSISLGWNVAKENFMSNLEFIDQLKFRASYGETGNPLGGNQQWNQRITTSDGYAFPSGEVGGFRTAFIANPSLGWETVVKKNIGADLVLWKGKLAFTTDFYINLRQNRLLAQPLPRIAGFGTFNNQGYGNRTDGYEFSITHKNKIGDFAYNVSANLGWAKNVWSERPNDIAWDNSQVGYPIRSPFGHHMVGWISDQAELEEYLAATTFQNATNRYVWIGTPILVDIGTRDDETLERLAEADGVINNFDRDILGNGDEGTYIVGANLGFSYKGFNFSTIIAGQFNRQLVSNIGNIFENGANAYTATRDLAFDPANPSDAALFPIPITRDLSYPTRPVINSEFVRVRNISLSYDFDIKKILPGVRSLQLYATAENPFIIWTNSPLADYGFDPEGGVNTAYPLNRATTLGVNIGF
nr:SusC/RagA family TonB-linked outer membrane protein [Allomuricauda sp.]